MPDLHDICSGLAANIKTADIGDFFVSRYFLDNPTIDTIQVAGVEDVDYDVAFQNAGITTDDWRIVIEVCLLRGTERDAQKRLRSLASTSGATSLKAAVEADPTLTKRLLDDGTVQTGQTAAADAVHVVKYRATGKHTLDNGVECMFAEFTVRVLT